MTIHFVELREAPIVLLLLPFIGFSELGWYERLSLGDLGLLAATCELARSLSLSAERFDLNC